MALTGLLSSIAHAADSIDLGRKCLATEGKTEEGRVFYRKGIAESHSAFKEASTTSDPQIILLADYTFQTQELELTDKSDKDTRSSLTQAVLSFDDAFLILEIVDDSTLYKVVDKAIPHSKKYRVAELYPKDAFHIACISHRTRLQNILRAPGIDPIEKELLKQRLVNLSVAQKAYIEKQKKALGK